MTHFRNVNETYPPCYCTADVHCSSADKSLQSLRNVEYIINYTVKVLFTNLFVGETENLPQNSEMTTNKQHGERKASGEATFSNCL